MASTASASEIDQFLQDALVIWISSCLNQPTVISSYSVLTDGSIFIDVLSQIEPDLKKASLDTLPFISSYINQQHVTSTRIKVFNFLVKSLQKIYEEELIQVIVCVPDCVCLGREPQSKSGLENMKQLLLLLLCCAVQCANKKIFIDKIKKLPVDVQQQIAEYITKVTDNQHVVMSREILEKSISTMQLIQERDNYMQKWIASFLVETNNSYESLNSRYDTPNDELRAKLNILKVELDEKSDFIGDLKSKYEKASTDINELKLENEALMARVRRNAKYRDEADEMLEKANRVDELERQIKKFQKELEKMFSLQMKNRELIEDNLALTEAKQNLESNIQNLELKTKKCVELELQLIEYKSEIDRLTQANDAALRRFREVVEENAELQNSVRIRQSSSNYNIDDGDYRRKSNLSLNEEETLLDQLSHKSHKEIIRLELENRKLLNENELANEDNQKLLKKLEKLSEQLDLLKNEANEFADDRNKLKKQISELQSLKSEQIETIKELKSKQLSQDCDQSAVTEKISKLEAELNEKKIENSNLQKDLFEEQFKIKRTKEFLLKLCKNFYDDQKITSCSNDDCTDANSEDINVDEIIEKLSVKNTLLDCSQYDMMSEIKELRQKLNLQKNTFHLAKTQLMAEKEELLQELQHKKVPKPEVRESDNEWRKLHDQLRIDYDQLMKQQESLKQENRDLRTGIEQLDNDLNYANDRMSLLQHNVDLNDVHGDQFKDLQIEHCRLKEDFQKLIDVNSELSNKFYTAKVEYKNLLNEFDKNRRHQRRVSNEYQTLLLYNYKLEDDRTSSMNLVENILIQYRELLNYTMGDKDRYYHETQEFTKKFHEMRRQKENLESKLMNYYQNLENSSAIKKISGGKFFDRFKKMGDIRNVFQRKQHESLPNDLSSLPAINHERQHSLPEDGNPLLAAAHRDNASDNNSILGSVRSRRGFYLSENDELHHINGSNSPSSGSSSASSRITNFNNNDNKDAGEINNNGQPPTTNGPSLMYLRVSNTYNGNSNSNGNGSERSRPSSRAKSNVNSKYNFSADYDGDIAKNDCRQSKKNNEEWHEFGII